MTLEGHYGQVYYERFHYLYLNNYIMNKVNYNVRRHICTVIFNQILC